MIDFLAQISQLKITKRTGWVNSEIPNPESISDHMYRMAIIAMLIKDKEIDKDRLLKIALVHDIAEAIVGDIVPGVMSDRSKYELELNGISKLQALLPKEDGDMIKELWTEYELAETREAKLCKDIDKYEMIQQCYEYEKTHGKKMQSFYDSTMNKFQHPEVITLSKELYAKRELLKLK